MISRRTLIHSTFATTGALATPALWLAEAQAAAKQTVSYGPKSMDIYAPGGDKLRPVMMFVHGGAWALGNKGQVGRKPKFFNRAGFVFASIAYTLYPAASAETQASQIAKAVAFMRANAPRFGGDPDRIILMGHSAGCHLASLATLSGQTEGLRGLVCNDTGAYDLKYLARINNGSLPTIYAAPFRKRKYWKRWSPITYAERQPYLPTFVPWSGGRNRDRITANFIGALRKSEADVTGFDGGDYSHMTINSSIGKRGDRLTNALMEFVDKAYSKPICVAPAQIVGNQCITPT